MSQNKPRLQQTAVTINIQPRQWLGDASVHRLAPGRSRAVTRLLWLTGSFVLAIGLCSTHLAGQNQRSTYSNPNVVNDDSSVRARLGSRPNTSISTLRKISRPTTSAPPAAKRDSAVTPAAFQEDPNGVAPAIGFEPSTASSGAFPPAVPPADTRTTSLPTFLSRKKQAASSPIGAYPQDRGSFPSITGSHLGLQPGETATERSLRLMTIIEELEQELTHLTEINAKQAAEIKDKDAKLLEAVNQMKAARKEMTLARDEFERLRKEITTARDKFRFAEQENNSLMRSLAPLIQQMLNGENENSDNANRSDENLEE